MSKPILFCDFDGTICFERYWRSLPDEQNNKLQNLLFGEDRQMFNDWMRGKYTAEEVNRFVAKELNIDYEELWELFVEDCKSMKVESEVLDNLNQLRQKYTTVLMTGNMDSFTRFTQPALELDKYFDHISNSYYEGKHKTDNNGELFLEWAEKLGGVIEESILLDDSGAVCDIFSGLSGKALKITTDKDVKYYLATL